MSSTSRSPSPRTGPGRSMGAVMAELLDVIRAKAVEEDLAGLAVLVWGEAVRNRSLAGKLDQLMGRIHANLVILVRDHQEAGGLPTNVTAEAIASTMLAVLPGYILQVALLDPAVWPRCPTRYGRCGRGRPVNAEC